MAALATLQCSDSTNGVDSSTNGSSTNGSSTNGSSTNGSSTGSSAGGDGSGSSGSVNAGGTTTPAGGHASGTTGAAGATSAAGAAGAPDCAPQDARGAGSGTCERALGGRWTGQTCEDLFGCTCEEADCGALSSTVQACAQAHSGCFDNAVCSDERQDIIDLVNANKACTDTSDCVTHLVGCGVTEDDCTGAVFGNAELDADELYRLGRRLGTCSAAFEGGNGWCGGCERGARSPSCIDGRCIAEHACTLEQNVMLDFIARNDSCDTVDDCTTAIAGCGVSQDGCTGAVYLNAGFDRAEFDRLRSAVNTCAAGADTCAVCERDSSPAACVAGDCQRG